MTRIISCLAYLIYSICPARLYSYCFTRPGVTWSPESIIGGPDSSSGSYADPISGSLASIRWLDRLVDFDEAALEMSFTISIGLNMLVSERSDVLSLKLCFYIRITSIIVLSYTSPICPGLLWSTKTPLTLLKLFKLYRLWLSETA